MGSLTIKSCGRLPCCNYWDSCKEKETICELLLNMDVIKFMGGIFGVPPMHLVDTRVDF